MFWGARPKLKSRKKAVKRKLGLKSVPHFPKGKIKGHVIYTNPEAIPVSPAKWARGKRPAFNMENVEWVSKVNQIAEGGAGLIFLGRIKFKGISHSQRIVIKEYIPCEDPRDVPVPKQLVLDRLRASKARAPKMALLEEKGKSYIIMEPYLKIGQSGRVLPKFRRYGALIRNLRLERKADRELFWDAVRQAGLLAKAGLNITLDLQEGGGERVDAFNAITLKSGKKQVFVQDLDSVWADRSPGYNWYVSTGAMFDVVREKDKAVAKRIINKVAREMGFGHS